MTTIYLTNWQYQMILDGQVRTHVDKMDNNHDGIITHQDAHVYCEGATTKYGPHCDMYTYSDLYDGSDEGYEAGTDIQAIGLSDEGAIGGYSKNEEDFGGQLYAYNVEDLNKVIDYYNNGGGYCDDDFEKHVYEGIGATGKKAPEGKYKYTEDHYFKHIEDDINASDYTDEEYRAMFVHDLLEAGATDIKYTKDGLIGSYTIDGVTYNMSSGSWAECTWNGATYDFNCGRRGEYYANDARTQELLAIVDQMTGKVNAAETEKAELEAEQAKLEEEQAGLEAKAAAAKADYEKEVNELQENITAANKIQNEIEDVNNAIEEENATVQKSGASNSSKSSSLGYKASSLASKLGGIKNNISTQKFSVIYSKIALSSINSNLNNVSGQVDDVNTQISAKNSEIDDLKAQIEEKQAELSSL
ncbi:MAG: hypothetical protein K6A44_06040 [bacterium]|nr:hypothetical protein [bacterium]